MRKTFADDSELFLNLSPSPTMKTRIETYLPIFSGFYHTIWDESDRHLEYELDNESDFRENFPKLDAVPWEFIKDNAWDTVNYAAGCLAVSQDIVDHFPEFMKYTLPEEFADMVTDCQFQKLVSPREYNFTNDGIDVEIEVDLALIQKYLKENDTAFGDYLKRRYTSRSGFFSSYPNDAEGWEEKTDGFTELSGHYLGSILQFIAENEGGDDVEWNFYSSCNTSEAWSNAAYIDGAKLLEKWESTVPFPEYSETPIQ